MTKAEVKAKVSAAVIQYVAPAEEVEIAGIETALDVAIKAYKAAELEYAKFVDLQVAVNEKDAELVNKINAIHKAITKTEGTYKRSSKRETLKKLYNRLVYLREEMESAMAKKRCFDGFKNHFDNARTDAYNAKCKTANEVTKAAAVAGYKFIVKIKTTTGEIKKYVRTATQAAGMIYQYSDVLVRWDILTVDAKYRPVFGYKIDGATQSKLENFIDATDEKYIDAEISETTTAKGEVTISNDEEGFKTIVIRSIHNFTLGNYTESIDELKKFVAKASGELRTKALAELQEWINIARAEGVEVEDYTEVEENIDAEAENKPVDAPNTSEGTNDTKTAEDTLKNDFSANDGQSEKISYQDLKAKIQVSYRTGKNGRENKIWGMYRNGGHIYNTGFIKVDQATAKKLLEENGWTVKEFVKADKAAKKVTAQTKAYNDAKSGRNMAGVAMTNAAKIEKAAEYYGLTVEEVQEIIEKVSAEKSAAKNSTVEDTAENVTFAHVKKGTGEYSCQVSNNESLIKICSQLLNPDALKFIDSYITALAGKVIEHDERLTYEGNNNIRINYHVENLNNGGLYIRLDIANIEAGTISISTTNSDNGKQVLTAEDVEKVIASLNLKPQTSGTENIAEGTLDAAEKTVEVKIYDSAATNDLANISYLMQARELENEYHAENGICLVNQVAQWNIQEQAQTLKNIAAVGKDFLLMYFSYKNSAKEYHEASVEKMQMVKVLDDQLQKEGAQVQRFDTLYWKNANAGKSKTAEKYAARYDEHYQKYDELRKTIVKLHEQAEKSRDDENYINLAVKFMENHAAEYVKNQPVTIEVDAEEIESAKIEEVDAAEPVEEKKYYAVSYTGYNSIRRSEKEFNSAIEAYKFLKKKIRKYSGSTYWRNQIGVQFLESGKLKFETIYENGVEIEERTTNAEIQALIDAENAEINHRIEINEINNCLAYWACECAVTPEAMETAIQAEIDNAENAVKNTEYNYSVEIEIENAGEKIKRETKYAKTFEEAISICKYTNDKFITYSITKLDKILEWTAEVAGDKFKAA